MDNALKIRTLTERFFDGETTLDEEQQLYSYFQQAPEDLPADLRPMRELFLDLQAVAAPTVAEEKQHTGQRQTGNRWRWAVAAVVAVLLTGGALTLFQRNQQEADGEELVAYIYGQRTTDPSVVLGEMQKTMTAMADDGSADLVEQQLKNMFSNE